MKILERHERIVDMVRDGERVAVEQLASLLRVSRETIRRDLSALAEQGRVRKIHGGVVLATTSGEGPLAARSGEAVPQKREIAKAAAALFAEGDTLFIDAGTTTLAFAEALAGRSGLTVITNGLEIARVLARGAASVFLVGGEYRMETDGAVGALAIAQIKGFFATHAVITVGGLTEHGAMDFSLQEAEVARAMVAQAREVTVVAHDDKLGRQALFQVCRLSEIDRLVVDRPPTPPFARELAEAGVTVVIAPQ